MIGYLLQFIVIILMMLPVYPVLRKPWQRERNREIAMGIFVLFMVGLLALAFQGDYRMPSRMLEHARDRLATRSGINLVPFRSIQAYFIHYGLDGFLVNFVGNIVMFMPWGFGLTLLWKKNRKLWLVALYSLGLTVFIESVQLFIGRSVDVDDVILNFVGGCLGAGICHVLRKKFPGLEELSKVNRKGKIMSQGKLGMRIGESVFCIGYLVFDLIAGLIFLANGSEHLFFLYGIMTLLLGFGDAFHLVPRVVKHIKGESERVKWWMDFGLMITSVTMTVFYIILLYIWKVQNVSQSNQTIAALAAGCTGVIWSMAVARIILCLLPQNDWFGNGNRKLSVCRNTVFAIIGIAEIVLFLMMGGSYGITMAVCIFLSFLFYIPVTLFAKENPKIGMLMIPKTIMYIVMISVGLAML